MARLYALSGGGGAGKTTLVHVLLRSYPAVVLRRTTTRPRRGDADEERHFNFVSFEEFEDRRSRGCFISAERSSGHHYGIERETIRQTLSQSPDHHSVIIGGEPSIALKRACPQHVTLVYVRAPLSDIEGRLRRRGDPPDVVAEKMSETRAKLAWEPGFYDHIIDNPDGALQAAFRRFEEIMGFVSPSETF